MIQVFKYVTCDAILAPATMQLLDYSCTLHRSAQTARQAYYYYYCLNETKTCKFFLWRSGPTPAMASSFLRFLDHTQRRNTVGRTPLVERSARRRDLSLPDNIKHSQQTNFTWNIYMVIFVPVVLCGFEARSLRMRGEESSFRLRENRRVGRTCGVAGGGVAGGALWFVLFSKYCRDN